jgi:hypothetical protein
VQPLVAHQPAEVRSVAIHRQGRDEDGLPVTVAWLRRHDQYEDVG